MKKTNKSLIIVMIVLLLIIALLLTGILSFMLVTKSNPIKLYSFKQNYGNDTFFSETYDDASLSKISKIVIDSDCGDIHFKNSYDNSMTINATGRYPQNFTVESKDDSINISYDTDSKLTTDSRECDIVVYIPQNFDKEIFASLSYGDIEADVVSNINIENDFGDIEIEHISGSFDIKSSYGDISIESIDINKSSTIQSSLGDIEIEQTNNIRIDYSVSLGSSSVNASNPNSDVVLKISAELGDIEIN